MSYVRSIHPGLRRSLALLLALSLGWGLALPAQAVLIWQIQTVDSAGDVGLDASLVLDSSGSPVISYFDLTNQDLKLVRCGTADCASGNSVQTVDSAGNVGANTSLVLDSNGNPVISYRDQTNGDLKLVKCGNATCTSGNSIQIVDSVGRVGAYTSLALDGSGNPVISYMDLDNDDLKLVRCGTADCASGNSIQTVDSVGFVGEYTSLALDSSGNPIISYHDDTNADLKLVHCGSADCASGNSFQTIDSAGDVGWYTSLALDSSGNPVIAYLDTTNYDLKLARSEDDPPPSVTINQAAGQADPATNNPVLFTAIFTEDVTGFTNADVVLSGTADLSAAAITLSGGPSTYAISVAGIAGNGTVIATIPANVATDGVGSGNSAATSTDNIVTFTVQAPGLLVGVCGGYEVRQIGNSYTAAGWSGAIKVGTNSNNTLNGGSGPDLILGLGGNDLLRGNGGNDLLCGGDGVDLLQGHAGNDSLDGGNGSDVLNGGSGDYDELLAGDGNDVLLDGDGVRNAAGGPGNDLFTLALRNGWRDANGQPRFAGLSGGYGNDGVGLAILNPVSFLVDITGDERDNPSSPLEGNNDRLALAGVIDPASTLIKFEQQVVLSATHEAAIPGEESGAEYLTEPVGEEATTPTDQTNRLFLPLVNR